MTTFARTMNRLPIARFLVLAGIVTVAGCGSYDNPQQATKSDSTPVAETQTATDAKPKGELSTKIAAETPKLPGAALGHPARAASSATCPHARTW